MEMWAGPSNACWLLRKSDDLFLGVTLWPCSNNLSPALPKILATPLVDSWQLAVGSWQLVVRDL